MLGDIDNREPGVSLSSRTLEEQVDLFQATRSSFGVEEVDGRNDDKVDDGVGRVSLVGDVGEHGRTCDDDTEVGEPVDGSGLIAQLVQAKTRK